RFQEKVTFTWVDYQLCRNAERPQRVPKLIRLGRRTLRIAFTNNYEGWCFDVFDELDRRTFFIRCRIVVNRRAEKRNHPLVNQVLAVITLQISNSGSGDRGPEAIWFSDGAHRHLPAIPPSGYAKSRGIDRVFFNHGVDTREIVTKIAV